MKKLIFVMALLCCLGIDAQKKWTLEDCINDAVTGPQCVKAGADLLVAGSALFGADDRAKVIDAFHAL